MDDNELKAIFDQLERSMSEESLSDDESSSGANSNSENKFISDNNKTIGRLKGEQELEHREKVLNFLQKLIVKSLELTSFMLFSNGAYAFFRNVGIVRWESPDRYIFSDDIIKYAISFLFIETLGVIAIVVRYLWLPRQK